MKVNLGCGTKGIEGWMNVDSSWNARISKHPKLHRILQQVGILPDSGWRDVPNLKIHDISTKLPFDDGSVECIYSSHVIEHLCRENVESLVSECHRILWKGGRLRLVTPDLEKFIDEYHGKYEIPRESESPYETPADRFISGTDLGEERDRSTLDEVLHSTFLREHQHRWLYDYESLEQLLNEAGFVHIQRCDSQSGEVPDLERLDHPSDQSVFVEAEK